jgi:transcriptional regulator with XRE-family HTH domain
MTGTNGSSIGGVAGHFGRQVRRDRLAHGWTITELAQRAGLNAAHLSRVENGKRPPTARIAASLDAVFTERRGWYLTWLEETRTAPEIPATFRSWSDYEERTTTLRVWMPTIIDGLVQTADYARTLIALSPGVTAATAEARLKARMERQRRVLASVRSVTLLVDEMALYRKVGDAAVMADQCAHLIEAAATPSLTVQVMPAIAHASVTSGYLIADEAVWCEHVVSAEVYTDPDIVMNVIARHDSLRAECYRASESLALIGRAEELWRSGESPWNGVLRPTAAATADSASK